LPYFSIGNVEEWLGKVEEGMFGNLRKLTKAAITDFEKRPRTEWVTQHASQVSYFPCFTPDYFSFAQVSCSFAVTLKRN